MRLNSSGKPCVLLLRVSYLALLGGFVAGCSSGFQRFDRSIYDSAVPQQTSDASNPYPGAYDPTVTNSVGGSAPVRSGLRPASTVSPKAVPQGTYHRPEPTYASPQQQQPQTYAPKPYQPYEPSASSSALSNYSSQAAQRSGVVRTPLSSPSLKKSAVSAVQTKVDTTRTASVQRVQEEIVAPNVEKATSLKSTADGWSGAGGTAILVQEGETLYNLSRRYGVPVSALRKVNGLSASDSLKSGQQITIPTYQFSKRAKVSAPDNDPKTATANATTGFKIAAVKADGSLPKPERPRYEPTGHTAPDKKPVSDHSIVTSSLNNGSYTVSSGDTLSRIASRHGTTVSALKSANGLSSDALRVGQTLALPGNGVETANVQLASTAPVIPATVDPITTASIQKPKVEPTKGVLDIDKDAKAPARSGISDFRWPASGRVITKFGEQDGSRKNEGIDISVPEGTAVRAAENGVVIYAGDDISSYGKLVLVRHEDGWVSAYGHNKNFDVKKGDKVARGQIIARSGRTGETERPKLHFELRKNATAVDPIRHLSGA